MDITASERRELAELVKVDEQYLYQCLSGRKDMKVHEAVRVERESGLRLRRWHLRRNDWWLNWPELIGAEGSPPVPAEAQAQASAAS